MLQVLRTTIRLQRCMQCLPLLQRDGAPHAPASSASLTYSASTLEEVRRLLSAPVPERAVREGCRRMQHCCGPEAAALHRRAVLVGFRGGSTLG